MQELKRVLDIPGDLWPSVLGECDENLKIIASSFKIKLINRNGDFIISGDNIRNLDHAEKTILMLADMASNGKPARLPETSHIIREIKSGGHKKKTQSHKEPAGEKNAIIYSPRGPVFAKTPCQEEFCKAILNYDVVFGIGPAGTGKTFLAVAMALSFLEKKIIDRIILVRPAVEAGENLGFLPGDFRNKIDPYLRPLHDAIAQIYPADKIRKIYEHDQIEIAPLAYMRGRTLSYSLAILDEAQNATMGQLKMFLTRLGPGSKAVITGDITQIDLRHRESSGLLKARDVLGGISGISFVNFTSKDVVRHSIVGDIIDAFAKYEEN